ncbi:MAG: branched-chain amino acid ABC transporter substrate-binding protein [Micromonosporaceae bacterium]|nr:branched-chain amino acid ABC transporter substrate-binding protein [Micromonosporaceae bacterium]
MTRRITALAVAAITLLGSAAACSKSNNNGGSSGGGKTLIVGVDLPFQGSSKDTSDATFNAMQLYLDSVGDKAGNYKVQLKKYDDSTAAAGKWDPGQCTNNANAHVANTDEVAVMGTYNSGCAQLEEPILNQDPNGPMLEVSHANTYPGLTKTWGPNEPAKFAPSGKRSYARVITTDDYQGTAAARFAAKDLGVKSVYVINDNELYGQGVAKAFADEAAKQGITVLGNQAWDGKQANYTALFTGIKAKNPDMIYMGGIYDLNGGQLVKDKVKVLGDNTKVKLMGPDGFTGYKDFDALPDAEGTYLTFAGQDQSQLTAAGGKAAELLNNYKTKYGSTPDSSYALYGVLALQVILQAISKSDGTRASVTSQVFSGSGIDISASDSVLGKDIKIDPASGDVNAVDISVLQMKGGKETFLKPYPVQ